MFGSRVDQLITNIMLVLGGIMLVLLSFSALEKSFERIDRENQEKLTWDCTANGGKTSSSNCDLVSVGR